MRLRWPQSVAVPQVSPRSTGRLLCEYSGGSLAEGYSSAGEERIGIAKLLQLLRTPSQGPHLAVIQEARGRSCWTVDGIGRCCSWPVDVIACQLGATRYM